MTTRAPWLVTQVRDCDSFATSSGREIRLANVCAPEKGRTGFDLAKQRLEALILNRNVRIVSVATDIRGGSGNLNSGISGIAA